MPPKKQAASGSAATKAAPAKKSKAAAAAAASAPEAAITRNKRWSAVSGSANEDKAYKKLTRDKDRAYSYICICPPPQMAHDTDSEDEWEDEDEDEDEDEEGDSDDDILVLAGTGEIGKCDGGKTCLCHKPANEHPDHTWTVTYAAFHKYMSAIGMAQLRTPDFFDMHTYNDHRAYGAAQVIQNLFLDFVEEDSWKEQWVVIEALVLFGFHQSGSAFTMMDDGPQADVIAQMVGRMFLTMLARLERDNHLSDVSEIKNLGFMMACYIKFAAHMRSHSLLEDQDGSKPKKSKKSKSARFKFDVNNFDKYILAYASKHGIKIQGPTDIEDKIADLESDVELPESGLDPWDWEAAFKNFSKDYAVAKKIGGDSLDITTWTSAQRRSAHFDHKDPLGRDEIKALKKGYCLQIM